MDDNSPVPIARAQLRFAQETVRGMARRVGVNLIIWSHVRQDMAALGVEELDVMHALQECRVSERQVYGSVERYCAVGRDTDDRSLRLLFVICGELHAIEVVSVSIV